MIKLFLKTYDKNFDKFIADFFKILGKENTTVILSTTNYVALNQYG